MKRSSFLDNDDPLEEQKKNVQETVELEKEMRALATMPMDKLIAKYKIKRKGQAAMDAAEEIRREEMKRLRKREEELNAEYERQSFKRLIVRDVECASCGKNLKPNDAQFACSACRRVIYCSETCADVDWIRHYRVCRKVY